MTDISLYPLTFKPIYQRRIWGGQRLKTLFGRDLPPGEPIGESWEIADLPNGQSVVDNGPLAGWTLRQVMARYGSQVMGCDWPADKPFPLLIKLLDAQDVLSVQVHPDEQACRRMGKGEPKTECWYILYAEPGAVIYKGVKPGVTRREFEKAIADGTCAQLLNKVPVRAGECHFLPAGLCHAIGAGLVIAEIQQPSDTTYRVFDWNRIDPTTGKPRPLHIQEALECIRWDLQPPAPTTEGRLVDAPQFKVDKISLSAGQTLRLDDGKMRVVMEVGGIGDIISDIQKQNSDYRKIEFKLCPAKIIYSQNGYVIGQNTMVFLEIYFGGK